MDTLTIIVIVVAIIACFIVGLVSWNTAIKSYKKNYDEKIGSAEARSREIIDEAFKTAETTKREALLEVKEELCYIEGVRH